MPFTDEEFEAWHEAKLKREWRPTTVFHDPGIATCVCCQRTFGITGGTVTEDFAICDACDSD